MRARLAADRRFGCGNFGRTPRVEAEWLDDKYVYYYGVPSGEAVPGRAAYEGTATTKIGVGLQADYAIGRRHNLFLEVAYDSFCSQVRDSPIVDDAGQTRVTVGYSRVRSLSSCRTAFRRQWPYEMMVGTRVRSPSTFDDFV